MRSLLALSIFVMAVACGGSTDPAEGPAKEIAPGANGPSDALACSNDARLTELAKDSRPALSQIVNDGSFAYWARRGAGQAVEAQIVRAPLAGGPVLVLVTGANVQGLALDDTHLYWTERVTEQTGDQRVVGRIPKGGGAPEVVVSRRSLVDGEGVDLQETTRLAMDGDHLVFGTRIDGAPFGTRYGVFRASKKPKAEAARVELTELAREHSSPLALVVDATSVYWVAEAYSGGEGAPRLASLRSADKHVRGPARVLAEGSTFEHKQRDVRFNLAIDDTDLYWLSQHDGAVMKIAKSGGTPIVLAGDERDFSSIAVGGGFVYWTWLPHDNRELGGLRRVPIAGGPVTTLAKDVWLMGVTYDPKGVVVTGHTLSRVTTCQ